MQILHMTKNLEFRDYRGGGKSSARETINWVAAGALKHILPSNRNSCLCFFGGRYFCMKPFQDLDFSKIESNDVRCPDEETAEK